MRVTHVLLLLVCLISALLALVIFMNGFFPLKSVIPGSATFSSQPVEPSCDTDIEQCQLKRAIRLPAVFGRMVFVLIDALRADFVLPDSTSDLPRMQYVSELIEKHQAFSYLAKAHPPTVTLPRIKFQALTTGGIPGFIDVVLNFGSSALDEDSLIAQMKRADKKMVFYGDDTWLRLFPNHFMRSEGTTSFFVTDFTEVDYNVTRHIDEELTSADWDVLVLHYLGLDHIGHLAGPRSSLVPSKLNEMDAIIKKIHLKLQEMDVNQTLPSLLVLCGDHGMSDQGSHGGASARETATPLVLISSARQDNTPGETVSPIRVVDQIDLVPTLSLLLGLPIPQNSLGIALTEMFQHFTQREKLMALHRNAQQMYQVFMKNTRSSSGPMSTTLERAVSSHKHWLSVEQERDPGTNMSRLTARTMEMYCDVMAKMRESTSASLITYDHHALVVGIVTLWSVLLLLYCGYCVYPSMPLTDVGSVTMATVLIFSGILSSFVMLHLMVCTSQAASALLCHHTPAAYVLSMAALAASALGLTVTVVLLCWGDTPFLWWINQTDSWISNFLIIGTILHSVSLLASSFVEEEHQTWYFFTTTLQIMLATKVAALYLQKHTTILPDLPVTEKTTPAAEALSKTSDVGESQDVESKIRLTVVNDPDEMTATARVQSNDDDVGAGGKTSSGDLNEGPSLFEVVCAVAALLLCRIARSWNRTGDKWAALPDVGDWLVSPDQLVILSVLTGLTMSVLVLLAYLRQRHHLGWVFLFLYTNTLVWIYFYRAASGSLLFPYLYDNAIVSKGIPEAHVIYFLLLLLLVLACWRCYYHSSFTSSQVCQSSSTESARTVLLYDIQMIWILLYLLVARPYNISLVVMVILQEQLTRLVVQSANLSPAVITLLYCWMGQAAYFYQGNSNSLSTVDVTAGYIGLEETKEAIVGLLMAVGTYGGVIFWVLSLIALLSHLAESHPSLSLSYEQITVQSCYLMWLTRMFPSAVYVILVTIERYHLFVWTVFSPKLLYEGMHSLILAILLMVSLLSTQLHSPARNPQRLKTY